MLNLLYAEDDKDDLHLFKEALAESMHATRLINVENGMELMEVLSLPIQYDFLFLDINMPYKDGLQCLREIRANDKLKNLTIIIFTSSGDEHTIKTAHEHGANLYITKPSSFAQWITVLEKALTLNYEIHTPHNSFDKFVFSLN